MRHLSRATITPAGRSASFRPSHRRAKLIAEALEDRTAPGNMLGGMGVIVDGILGGGQTLGKSSGRPGV